MKKIFYLMFLMIFTLSASTAFAIKSDPKRVSDNNATPVKTENKLTEEEMARLKTRVEEIRDMDKENLTTSEKKDLRHELKGIKENVKNSGGYVYVGVGTILLIILLVILLV